MSRGMFAASTADTRRLATIHLCLHSAMTDTKYTGTLQVGLL